MVHRIVKPFTLFFILSAFLASSCLAEIHWTFHPSVHGVDGPSAAYVTTALGGSELKYVLPAKWTLSDTRFIPPGNVQANAFVVAVPIQAPAPWTPDRGKELDAAALSHFVPGGATGATVLSEAVLPVKIDGQSAYEISISYSFYAQAFTECIVYVEHGKTQLQFHLVALRNDYPNLHGAFIGSLLSLDGF
jgi:hypothetical protein